MIKLISLLTFVLFVSACNSNAGIDGPAKFTWDLSANSSGYKLYCGSESNTYTSNITIVGGFTSNLLLSQVALDDGIHYCALTAFNFAGESGFSNEIAFDISSGELVMIAPLSPSNLNIE